jgi:hypothetical protein
MLASAALNGGQMRSIEGQRSDRVPVRRDRSEKEAQLRALRARLGAMKSHESPGLRASIEAKIAELEGELR